MNLNVDDDSISIMSMLPLFAVSFAIMMLIHSYVLL